MAFASLKNTEALVNIFKRSGYQSASFILAAQQHIKALNFEDYDLADDDIFHGVTNGLPKLNECLQALSLNRTGLVVRAMSTLLISAVATLHNLQQLHLCYCNLDGEGIPALCTVLLNCKNIVELDVSYNPLRDDGVLQLLGMMGNSTTKPFQRLGFKGVLLMDGVPVVKLLLALPQLSFVDLTENLFDNKHPRFVATMKALNQHMLRNSLSGLQTNNPPSSPSPSRRSQTKSPTPNKPLTPHTSSPTQPDASANRSHYNAYIRQSSRSPSNRTHQSHTTAFSPQGLTHVFGKEIDATRQHKSSCFSSRVERTFSRSPSSTRCDREKLLRTRTASPVPENGAAGLVSYVREDRRDIGYYASHPEEMIHKGNWAFQSGVQRRTFTPPSKKASSVGPGSYQVKRYLDDAEEKKSALMRPHTFGSTSRITHFSRSDFDVPGPGKYVLH